jgi:hypothetical protein
MFGKNKTEAMPASQTLTLSPYGTPEGAALAGDITSGAKKILPGQTAWANEGANQVAENLKGTDSANITNFGRNLLNYNAYTDRPFQDALAAIRGGSEANVANDQARMRSQMAKVNQGPMSTAYQMANQSAAAANRADTNRTIAGLVGQQGQFGKQLQMSAPGIIESGMGMPGRIAESAADVQSHPYFNALQALQADRTPVYQQQGIDYQTSYKPGILDRVGQVANTAAKVYGMVNPAAGMAMNMMGSMGGGGR